MEREFAKKNLFITGATSGIGRATALRFAQAGANVAAVGRDEVELKHLEQTLVGLNVRCVMIPADLARDDSVEAALYKAIDVLGGLDILVNAAGHISNGTIETTTI
jgi:NAD(P)-dependent dehydrogenase (short-subunit alcohol dehydrogenase family)